MQFLHALECPRECMMPNRSPAADTDANDAPRERVAPTVAQQLIAAPTVVLRSFRDILVPPACMSCQRPLASTDCLCASCWQTVTFISHPLCDRLGVPMPYDTGDVLISADAFANPPDYDRARAACIYDGVVRRLISGFKYHDRQEPRALFARWLITAGRDLLDDCDVIVPVPLHRLRLIARRFNQSALLAQAIGRETDQTVFYHVLRRHKRTPQQVGLTLHERKRNPRGAFEIKARDTHHIAGRRVLLIDDVLTTGATVNACARALKRAGATGVDVLTLAMSVDDGRDPLY
ncbi:MAG: ComF family protein [Pseudomonadota bacterium]